MKPTTPPRHIHLFARHRDVGGWRIPVAACGYQPAQGFVTDQPERVTCAHCRAAMGAR